MNRTELRRRAHD